jgi:hypothetical protein
MTSEEKELLADRVVALLKDPNPHARLAELRARIESGKDVPDEEGVVLALTTAMLEHLHR